MIKLILDFLDSKLVNWPVNLLGLAEMHIKSSQDVSIIYPLIYKGRGKYDAVNTMNHIDGWIYHRTDQFSDVDVDRGAANTPRIERSIPFITVALVSRDAANDTVFSASELAETLANQIGSDFFEPENVTSRSVVNDTIYNSKEVHALEFQGIDFFVPSDMVMIRVNWTAKFMGDVTCFPSVELC